VPRRSSENRTIAKKNIRNLRGVATFAVCTVTTIFWVVPIVAFAIVKLLVPIPSFRRLLSRWIMDCGEFWVDGNAIVFGLRDPALLDMRGLEGLSRDNWYLVMSNHQTWVDIIVLQVVFNRRIPFLKFFIKQELIWFPFLGIAWWAMDMPFMKRHSKSYLAKHPEKKGSDFEATRKACEKFRDTPTTVINFIEGTRFTPEKKVRRNSKFQHLLPPRAGGVALALTSMGGMFDCILDITIVYPKGVAQFWALCCGEFDGVIIDIRKLPVEEWMSAGDYANDRQFRSRFHRWLTRLWQEKDQRIDTLLAEKAGNRG
jgi:1-acyl-sn-glycerol-3-phosphate acyltransferase